MRTSMQVEHRLCSLLRQRLSARKEATSVALPRTEALYPHGGPPYVALPQTEALCLHGGPPYVALSDRGSLSLRQRLSVRMKDHHLWPSLRQGRHQWPCPSQLLWSHQTGQSSRSLPDCPAHQTSSTAARYLDVVAHTDISNTHALSL